ncbi:MAG: phage major capsid protein [Peptoanaerobacter stomatis]|uniref:phage major capsid protein n=1 Tax=Peptoanaerobacter stomatis TaxID=796937 RepID=UPI003FA09370
MALRKLMLINKKTNLQDELNSLRTQDEQIQTRERELEEAIKEAKTEDETKLVEEEVEKFENDKKELEDKKQNLQSKINEIDSELEEIDKQEPERKDNKTVIQRRENNMIFTRDKIHDLVQRDDVKDLLTQVRSLISRKDKSIVGAELTIPTVMIGLIRDEIHRYSKLINRVYKKPTSGKARALIAGAVPEGVWMEACGTLNELALQFHMTEVDGYKIGGFMAICNATLEDSDIDLANEIIDALGQAIGYALDKGILYGTGKKMATGIVTRLHQASKPDTWITTDRPWINLSTTNVKQYDPAGANTAEGFFSDIIGIASAAKPNYIPDSQKTWVMNSNTATIFLQKSIAFNAAGALVASAQKTMPIIGGDIIILEFVPDGDVIGGYFKGYLLAERKGISLGESKEVRFIQDQTVFKGTARYDGTPIIGEAFVHFNIKNVAPTKTVTFAPDTANPGL